MTLVESTNRVKGGDNITQTFKIPYPATKKGMAEWNRKYGLNAYYAGKHWAVRKKDAEYWHALTAKAVRECIAEPKIAERPVVITVYFNDNMDCTNHASILKMIEDGLKGILIEDDDRKHVRGVSMYFHEANYILVHVAEIAFLLRSTEA